MKNKQEIFKKVSEDLEGKGVTFLAFDPPPPGQHHHVLLQKLKEHPEFKSYIDSLEELGEAYIELSKLPFVEVPGDLAIKYHQWGPKISERQTDYTR